MALLRHDDVVPVPIRIIQRDTACLNSIETVIGRDRDLELEGMAYDVRSLQDAEIAIVNLEDLTSYDLARLQLLGAPPGVALISTSHSPEKLASVRSKSVALLQEPLSAVELSDALGAAKDVVLLRRMESLTSLMAAYKAEETDTPAVAVSAQLPPAEDIEWIEADGNYVNVHTTDGFHRLRMTMTEVEKKFTDTSIVRGHRKWFVNTAKIEGVQFESAGGVRLSLTCGKDLIAGRFYRQTLRQRLRDIT